MRLNNTAPAMAVCVAIAFCSMASAQSLRIGGVVAQRGKTVVLPVTLTAATSHTAALLRVQYNTAVLENAGATTGPLMTSGHALDSHAPALGRFDVAVYAPSGMLSFKAKTGVVFHLTFRVKANAPSGECPITFTTVGTPALPAADLVGITGAAVSPVTYSGSVRIVATEADPAWILYR